jgi:hypothetical protein
MQTHKSSFGPLTSAFLSRCKQYKEEILAYKRIVEEEDPKEPDVEEVQLFSEPLDLSKTPQEDFVSQLEDDCVFVLEQLYQLGRRMCMEMEDIPDDKYTYLEQLLGYVMASDMEGKVNSPYFHVYTSTAHSANQNLTKVFQFLADF